MELFHEMISVCFWGNWGVNQLGFSSFNRHHLEKGDEADHWTPGDELWKEKWSWLGRPGTNSADSLKTWLAEGDWLVPYFPVGAKRTE